ncbi:hypothetical protein AVEN_95080-1 [Araneus ventricosus]|uniref:Uncharacterized protein n=1 Tax=Araneus ventricosus TaxID=182803 RepID=A0A4Y2UC09_ARAVE|nr:hypothetical protein AVEN_95080-1 [Araneus ventricosus]
MRRQSQKIPLKQQRSSSPLGLSKLTTPETPPGKDFPTTPASPHGEFSASTNGKSTPSQTPDQTQPNTSKLKKLQTTPHSSADNDNTIIYYSTPSSEVSHPPLPDIGSENSPLKKQSPLPDSLQTEDDGKTNELEIVFSSFKPPTIVTPQLSHTPKGIMEIYIS